LVDAVKHVEDDGKDEVKQLENKSACASASDSECWMGDVQVLEGYAALPSTRIMGRRQKCFHRFAK
jgi:hypothetical protein